MIALIHVWVWNCRSLLKHSLNELPLFVARHARQLHSLVFGINNIETKQLRPKKQQSPNSSMTVSTAPLTSALTMLCVCRISHTMHLTKPNEKKKNILRFANHSEDSHKSQLEFQFRLRRGTESIIFSRLAKFFFLQISKHFIRSTSTDSKASGNEFSRVCVKPKVYAIGSGREIIFYPRKLKRQLIKTISSAQ